MLLVSIVSLFVYTSSVGRGVFLCPVWLFGGVFSHLRTIEYKKGEELE